MNISIDIADQVYFIDVRKTVYIGAFYTGVRCYLDNGENIYIPTTIDLLKTRLEEFAFFRTNHKHLINLNFISKIETQGENSLILKKNLRFHITESKKQPLFKKLNKLFA